MKKTLLLIATSLSSVAYFAQGCSDLYFSEYIEGSSNNKAIEIYNPTNQPIDLSNYIVYRSNNGSQTPTDTLKLTGVLNGGDVYVAANPSADATGIVPSADTLHSITFYNGDDALELYNGTTLLDVIGVVGTDPGSSWSVDTGATREYTLVRKPNVNKGNLVWLGEGDTTWIAYSQDDFSYIGSHSTNGCSQPIAIPMVDNNTKCYQTAFSFSEASTGGAPPYSYMWEFGDGNTSNLANPTHTYAAAGTYDVTLTITDQSFVGLVDDSTIVVTATPCVSVDEKNKVDKVTIYPNPTKNGIVNLSKTSLNAKINVYNVIGELVYSKKNTETNQLNLSALDKGTYFVNVIQNSAKTTKKLIIE